MPVRLGHALACLFALSALITILEDLIAPHLNAGAVQIVTGMFGGLAVLGVAWAAGYLAPWIVKTDDCSARDRAKLGSALKGLQIDSQKTAFLIFRWRQPYAGTISRGLGETVVISTGLIRKLAPAELSGVVAHELGHQSQGHPKKLAFVLGMLAAAKMAFPIPVYIAIPVFLVFLMMLRQWELAADRVAMETRGEHAILAALSAFRRLEPDDHLPTWRVLLSAYPRQGTREEAVRAFAKKRPPPIPTSGE